MIRDKSQRIFTIPNVLSIFRLILIPVFIYVYQNAETQEDFYFATLIFTISAISDSLDGFIARKFDMITELGKFLDPLADKLTQISLLFCIAHRYNYVWFIAFICVFKDLFMAIMGLVMIKLKRSRLDGAKWFGKFSTALTYVVILILLLFPNLNIIYVNTIIIVCGIFMVLSFILYIKVFREMWTEN